MNFQAVRNANGGYVTMFALVMTVVPKVGNFGPQVDCTVTDDSGETGLITVSNSKPPKPPALPTIANIGQKLSFYVKAKVYSATKTYYNGYWNSTASVAQQPITSSPMGQAPSPTGIPQEQSKTLTDSSIRTDALNAACVLFANSQDITDMDAIATAMKFEQYILKGQKPMQPDALDDDMPFPPSTGR